ncbi:MAG: DUF1330 domain-containing protein [Actinomycetota bacterium]
MTTTVALYPTEKQAQELLAGPADQPVVMVNLLRFKPAADAPNEGLSGEEAYRQYATPMIAFVMSKGGRLIWSGRVDSQVIGEGGEDFQIVALVEYPSRKSFLEIAADPHFEEISVHRASGLEGQWLIATTAAE